MFENIVHKRRAFEHEREVRAVAQRLLVGQPNEEIDRNANEFGYFPEVAIDNLIECVYVHPLADDWFLEAVSKVVRLAAFNLSTHRSALAAIPVS
jgi:hypothetical protein